MPKWIFWFTTWIALVCQTVAMISSVSAVPLSWPQRLRTAPSSRELTLGPVPRGFVAVDPSDGSLAYSGPSLVKRRLEANQVRLVVMRHGQSQSNADSEQQGQILLYGQSESPLTPLGREQARDCASELYRQLGGDSWLQQAMADPRQLPVFVSSPVSRASESAELLVDHLKERVKVLGGPEAASRLAPWLQVHTDPRLLESHFGRFETRPLSEVEREYPDFIAHWRPPEGLGTDFRHRFPGGESRSDVMNRMTSFLDSLALLYPGRTVCVMGHGESLLGARAVLGLIPEQEGKLRAQGGLQNATPYWLIGQSR
ncbi:histidine phosphatase family protein [bacterium CPR1]|nr:histidine phosphatase family protein [bacterium CPR1]